MVGLVHVFDYKLQELRPSFPSPLTAAPRGLIIKMSHVLLQHVLDTVKRDNYGQLRYDT